MKYVDMFDERIMSKCSRSSFLKYERIREFVKTKEFAKRIDDLKIKNWYMEIFADLYIWKIEFISREITWEEKIGYFEFLLDNKVKTKYRGEMYVWECKGYESYELTSRIHKFRKDILSKEEKIEYERLRLVAKAENDEKLRRFREENGNMFGGFFDKMFVNHNKNYETLGIKMGATQQEIKKAYRKMSKIHHPDVGGSNDKFNEINTAYKALYK